MTRKKSHVHQYRKRYPFGPSTTGPLKGRAQWECGLPDCSHFLPGNMGEPVDKMSLCNNCMEVFVLERHHMEMDEPLCTRCANPDRPKVPDNLFELDEARRWLRKLGVNRTSELTPMQRALAKNQGIDVSILEPYEKDEVDEVEVIEPDEPTSE